MLFTFSCHNIKNTQSITSTSSKIITIDNVTNYEPIYLDSIANIKLIQLSKPDSQIYIGRVKKIVSHNDSIYISNGKNIFIYDMNGKCKSTFNKIGKANHEYLGIYDFEIVDTNFYIIDRDLCKILSYSINGDYISSLKLDFYPKSIKKINDSSILICAENDVIDQEEKMKFHIYDIDMNKIINSFFPIDIYKGKYLKHMWNNNYTIVNDSIFYYEPNDNTILHVTPEKYSSYLTFDFGKNEPPTEFYQKNYENVASFFYEFHENQYASGTYWAIWNDSTMLFQFVHNKALKVAQINRQNHHVTISKGVYINKDQPLGEIYTYDNKLLSYIELNEMNEKESLNDDIVVIIAVLKK